jgi:hypothetical protein
MMSSPPIHRRTGARDFARLSPGSTPACAGSRVWPAVAAQIQCRNPIRSLTPVPTPKLPAKPTGSPVSADLLQHSR